MEKTPMTTGRTRQAIAAHFAVERELAERLKAAPRAERSLLYAEVYEELFRRVPDHPQLRAKEDPELRAVRANNQMRLLAPLLTRGGRFVEIGAGDCALSLAAAEHVSEVVAVDVSPTISRNPEAPSNFEYRAATGCALPLPDRWADLCYSHQLIEHLHPDDAVGHLVEVRRILRPGGQYLCITAGRHSGPHDISRHFADTAQGFHLREYTASELADLMHACGLCVRENIFCARARRLSGGLSAMRIADALFGGLPAPLRRILRASRAVQHLTEVRLLAAAPE